MAWRAYGTGFQHGTSGYDAETQLVSVDYEYSIIEETGGNPWSWQVKVYFTFDANTLQIQTAVRNAIIADVFIRIEETLLIQNIKLLV